MKTSHYAQKKSMVIKTRTLFFSLIMQFMHKHNLHKNDIRTLGISVFACKPMTLCRSIACLLLKKLKQYGTEPNDFSRLSEEIACARAQGTDLDPQE